MSMTDQQEYSRCDQLATLTHIHQAPTRCMMTTTPRDGASTLCHCGQATASGECWRTKMLIRAVPPAPAKLELTGSRLEPASLYSACNESSPVTTAPRLCRNYPRYCTHNRNELCKAAHVFARQQAPAFICEERPSPLVAVLLTILMQRQCAHSKRTSPAVWRAPSHPDDDECTGRRGRGRYSRARRRRCSDCWGTAHRESAKV